MNKEKLELCNCCAITNKYIYFFVKKRITYNIAVTIINIHPINNILLIYGIEKLKIMIIMYNNNI